MTDVATLWSYPLRRGASPDPAAGACLLDAVSWFEYGRLGDHPPCVSPAIAAIGRAINDLLGDDNRQLLRPYIPRLVNTVDPMLERHRMRALIEHLEGAMFFPVLAALYGAGFLEWAAGPIQSAEAYLWSNGLIGRRAESLPGIASWIFYLTDWRRGGSDSLNGALHAAQAALYSILHPRGAVGTRYTIMSQREVDILAGDSLPEARERIPTGIVECLISPFRPTPWRDPAILLGGLDAMLAIGRQAEPAPPARMQAAIDSFARAARAPLPTA